MSHQYLVKVRVNAQTEWGAAIFEDDLKGVQECINEFLENLLAESAYIEFRVEKPFRGTVAEPRKRAA